MTFEILVYRSEQNPASGIISIVSVSRENVN